MSPVSADYFRLGDVWKASVSSAFDSIFFAFAPQAVVSCWNSRALFDTYFHIYIYIYIYLSSYFVLLLEPAG